MDRRRFLLTSLAGAVAAPLGAEGQQARPAWRLAWLGEGTDPGPTNVAMRPFIEGLRDLGYVEGHHFTLARRFAGGRPERLRDLAAELVEQKLDLIAAPGTQALLALKAATSDDPHRHDLSRGSNWRRHREQSEPPRRQHHRNIVDGSRVGR